MNGQHDSSEPGIANVDIKIRPCTDGRKGSTTTGVNGDFIVTKDEGCYYAKLDASTYQFVDGGGVDVITGQTDSVTLKGGKSHFWTFGVVPNEKQSSTTPTSSPTIGPSMPTLTDTTIPSAPTFSPAITNPLSPRPTVSPFTLSTPKPTTSSTAFPSNKPIVTLTNRPSVSPSTSPTGLPDVVSIFYKLFSITINCEVISTLNLLTNPFTLAVQVSKQFANIRAHLCAITFYHL